MINELFTATLDWIAAHPHWLELAVFLTALGESLALVGMLVPGAMMMFGFGALIALGYLDFAVAMIWAVAGAFAGDALSFWLGRAFHQRLRQLWPFSRHPEMLIRGERFFHRHGGKSVLFGRFFGPVRAVIPAVAGMLDMPAGRFLAVNIASAVLWAPAYLLPGMVFAASLELAAQVAWRLMVLILLLVALLWLTVWAVRVLVKALQPRVRDWLRRLVVWSKGRLLIGSISVSLLDPDQGELRGLAIVSVILIGGAVFINLLLDALGQEIPGVLDYSLFRFLQDLRTPWADRLMVIITELGDYEVYLSVTAVVCLWLCWQHAFHATLYWLAAVGFGWVMSTSFKWTFQVMRPVDLYAGVTHYSFPSTHATVSAVMYGFFAVLIARETRPAQRWIPYLGASLLAVTIAFSRIYLGAHWLTDVVAGLCLGLIWITLLGVAYSRHAAPRLHRGGLLLAGGGALLVSMSLHTWLHTAEDLRFYQAKATTQTLDRDRWWQDGWRQLPTQRRDFSGDHQQLLDFQWATSQQELRRRLASIGWQLAPVLSLSNMLLFLSPQVTIDDLPVLPRVHDGRHPNLTLVHRGAALDSRWVLRFWDAGVRFDGGDTQLWVGSLTLQRLEHRANFLAVPVLVPDAQPPETLIQPALRGLKTRTVNITSAPGAVTLIAP